MKRIILLLVIISILTTPIIVFAAGDKSRKDEPMRKSRLSEHGMYQNTSFPMPFTETGNDVSNPPVSTGYYFVDSDDEAPDYWRPNPEIIDTTQEPDLWRRILSGPRQKPASYWATSPDGLCFFRNPAVTDTSHNFFKSPTDSTDDAIAGPIPIGFNFFFNGLKFDSFYVSTNGIICLTNDRYFYESNKKRTIPAGSTSSYNPMSNDWFARSKAGDGLTDTIPDDYGYTWSVCGGEPTTNPLGGIRQRGGTLTSGTFTNFRNALIAPFFGDLHLSQFNVSDTLKKAEDWGKVYFKRTSNNDRLYIYFINIAPVRTLNTQWGTYNGKFNLRPGDQNYIAASAQVVLDKRDSSVTIQFEKFDGVAVVSGRGVPANTIFRYNTTCGVAGFARHVNYAQSGGTISPWAGEYQQYTNYFMQYANPQAVFPHSSLAVKFKQWKNSVRIVDLSYRVRKTDPKTDLKFTEIVPTSSVNNYELLAGEERIGSVQPVAIFQNMTNNIQGPQGVNYQPQQLRFRARFRIINQASLRIIYNRLVPVDSACLALPDSQTKNCIGDSDVKVRYSTISVSNGNYTATEQPFPGKNNYNGIPPYGFVQVFFPPFEPNEYVNNHIGQMSATIIAETTDPATNESLNDGWPFDDSLSLQLFVMKRLSDFSDDVTSFHIVDRSPVPSTLKWVNIDAEVQQGEDVSKFPCPPRGDYFAPTNNYDFSFSDPDYTKDFRSSPVIRMDRKTLNRSEPAKSPGGDQLRSFPIDLRGRFGSVISMSIQRTAKKDDWVRGWADQELTGPEPRSVVNADVFHVWTEYNYAASNIPDELDIELAQPSPDGIQYITNIDDKHWRNHPRRKGAKPVTDMAAYTLFGAGGHMVGFLETDKDSALSMPGNGLLGGLRPDLYDDGIDYEYNKIFIAIPDTFIKSKNEGAKNFRFRLNVQATNFKIAMNCSQCIADDDDPFFVDNVKITFPSEMVDIEVQSVSIQWPYTVAPASQAVKIPVRVNLINNDVCSAPPFRIKVRIFKQGDSRPVYCRTENLPFMSGGAALEYPMPYWNARICGPGTFRLIANVIFGDPGNADYDLEPLNDTNYTDVTLRFGDAFAYDPTQNPRSDVSDNEFTGIPGRGLNMYGFNYGGMGSINGPSGFYDENNYGAGYIGGSGSGQIAMKFQLYQPDTLKGYNAYYVAGEEALDDISLTVYGDANGQPNQQIVPGSQIYTFKGWDDIRKNPFFDEYITHLLKKPLVLQAGIYWIAIGQLGETGIELGASKSRSGMRTTSVSIPLPVLQVGSVGGGAYNLMLDKDFRKKDWNGNLVNNNLFCFENLRGSGNWVPFMPTKGNPAYAHLHAFGISPADGLTATLSRGTWIPMIRPYFGNRDYGKVSYYEDCADDMVPVELTYFDGIEANGSIELYWETASESNNRGFYVERRQNENDDNWSQVSSLLPGAGNSKQINRYNFVDKSVVPNTTYQYRLRQIDMDGLLSCQYSKVITLTLNVNSDLSIDAISPNPIQQNIARISFTLPQEEIVKLEILDIYGNTVKILVNKLMSSGSYSDIVWNAAGNDNLAVSNGVYICRLTAGNKLRTKKMTVVK